MAGSKEQSEGRPNVAAARSGSASDRKVEVEGSTVERVEIKINNRIEIT